jgi:hypothetical protein
MTVITLPYMTPAAISFARVLIVGLAIIPLTLVVMASIPALVIMPFIPGGSEYVEMAITRMAIWSVSVIRVS